MIRKFVSQENYGSSKHIFKRTLTGRITKARYKCISRYCRVMTFVNNCGCSHDCCGHLVEQLTRVAYKRNQIIVTLVRIYNY